MSKRTTALLVAGMLTAAACGDDGGSGNGNGNEAFCKVDEEFADMEPSEANLQTMVDRLGEVEPPSEVADAYNTFREGLEAAAAGNQDQVDRAEMQDATDKLTQYSEENC